MKNNANPVVCGCISLVALLFFFAACTKTVTVQGPKGDTGATGAQGTPGPQGQAGPAGSRIFSGTGAPADALGMVGDYYIDRSTGSLYGPKTVSGWGTSISLQGTQGSQGPQGPQGDTGATGAAGPAGKNGDVILSGLLYPTPLTGSNGDYYFDRTNDTLYGPKTVNGWGYATSLRGAAGATGSANVIYYSWVAFDQSKWSTWSLGNQSVSYSVSMPPISLDIVNTGVILVYVEYQILGGTAGIIPLGMFQLPGEFNNTQNGNENELLSTTIFPGQLKFTLLNMTSFTANPGGIFFDSGNSAGYVYRIVIIPGGVVGTADPRTLSYGEVCSRYGIQP